jgi:hypothetical protein
LGYPDVHQSLDRLNQSGWAMGDLLVKRDDGQVWLVTGHRGKHWIIAQAPNQAAAWWLARRQADKLKRTIRVGKSTRRANYRSPGGSE